MPSSETVQERRPTSPGRPLVSAEFLLMLLADGRLPTGAHTQSAGVEPALDSGMALTQVPAYIGVRLQTVTEVEAATAVVARQLWLDAARGLRGARLAEVDAAWRARTPSDALRDASDLLGRSHLRLASALWDLGLAPSMPTCRPVVVGAVAAAAGLAAAQTARLVGYDDVQTVVAAALKIRPFDPSVGVRWVAAAGVEVDAMVSRVQGVRTVDDIPAWGAPLIEQWGQAHQGTERRLYRA